MKPTEMEKEWNLHTERKGSAQLLCMVLGVVFVVLGLAGMLFSGIFGAHWGLTMNFLHLASGVVLFMAGSKDDKRYAYYACIAGTIFCGGLALIGWGLGQYGHPTVGFEQPDLFHVTLIKGHIELGLGDNIINTILAIVLSGGWYMSLHPHNNQE